jgi:hypothetical protein
VRNIIDAVNKHAKPVTADPKPPEPDPDVLRLPNDKPVDLARAVRDFPYYKANREIVLAERSRVKEKARREAEEKSAADHKRRVLDERFFRPRAEKEIAAEDAEAERESRAQEIQDRSARVQARIEQLRKQEGN